MKMLLYMICFGLVAACSKDEPAKVKEFNDEVYPQKWKLVKMTGSMANSETTGSAMSWQETYLLKSDNSFIKSRVRDNVTTEAKGTYAFTQTNNENLLVLTYDANNELIGSCLSNSLQESFMVRSTTSVYSTWQMCDGPGLEYERIE
jgi:hypothetical protein